MNLNTWPGKQPVEAYGNLGNGRIQSFPLTSTTSVHAFSAGSEQLSPASHLKQPALSARIEWPLSSTAGKEPSSIPWSHTRTVSPLSNYGILAKGGVASLVFSLLSQNLCLRHIYGAVDGR